jgi:hypothetical protein
VASRRTALAHAIERKAEPKERGFKLDHDRSPELNRRFLRVSYAILATAVIVPSRCDPNHRLRDNQVQLSSACEHAKRRPTMLKRIALALLLLGTVMTTAGISLAPTAALAEPPDPCHN